MKRIRKIGLTSFILLISSLILVIFLIAFSFKRNSASASRIAHTWEVKNTIRRLSATISEMESKKLAIIYTNQIKYRHAFKASQEQYDSLLNVLRDLVADNVEQGKRLHKVDSIVTANFDDFGVIGLTENKSPVDKFSEGNEEILFASNIQNYLEEMAADENKLLEERNESYVMWQWIIVVGLIAATIIIFISLYSLIKRIRPLVEELMDTKEDLEKSNRNLSATLAQLERLNNQNEIEIKAKELAIEQTEKLNNSLSTKNQQLDHFAYVASHDLQEPLRTVSNYLEIFQEDYPERLEGEATMYFEFINSAVERMRKLISGLLSFSRLGTSGEAENIDLNITLSRIQSDLATVIEKNNITIKSDKLPTVYGYRIEIKQLFQNLISNAIKFTKPDVTPYIAITFDETNNFYNFHITDNGIGIPDKDFSKIFDMFSRLHSTKDYEGQGIGLAFCKKIVELHHGNIWVTSEFGKGSTIHFTLKK